MNAARLDALLEIEELDAVQWTPGVGQPQGGDPTWFEMYRKIRAAKKSVMASLVEVDELEALLDAVGPAGLHVLMEFRSPGDIDRTLEIVERFHDAAAAEGFGERVVRMVPFGAAAAHDAEASFLAFDLEQG